MTSVVRPCCMQTHRLLKLSYPKVIWVSPWGKYEQSSEKLKNSTFLFVHYLQLQQKMSGSVKEAMSDKYAHEKHFAVMSLGIPHWKHTTQPRWSRILAMWNAGVRTLHRKFWCLYLVRNHHYMMNIFKVDCFGTWRNFHITLSFYITANRINDK